MTMLRPDPVPARQKEMIGLHDAVNLLVVYRRRASLAVLAVKQCIDALIAVGRSGRHQSGNPRQDHRIVDLAVWAARPACILQSLMHR